MKFVEQLNPNPNSNSQTLLWHLNFRFFCGCFHATHLLLAELHEIPINLSFNSVIGPWLQCRKSREIWKGWYMKKFSVEITSLWVWGTVKETSNRDILVKRVKDFHHLPPACLALYFHHKPVTSKTKTSLIGLFIFLSVYYGIKIIELRCQSNPTLTPDYKP